MTGLPIEGVKHYIDLCQEGDSTIPERAELIFKQEKSLREQLRILKKQMEVLKYKKKFYQDLLDNGSLAAAREKGIVGMEGKEYVVKDGDVILFRFNV